MVRRIFAIVLIVLGLGTAGAAIASGTIWRPDDRVTLTLPATPDVPLVITAPGVLNAVDNEVDVHLVGATDESPIVLAMARESDVRAWVGDAPHWEITGLTDWETLAYTDSRDVATDDPSAEETDGTETPAETDDTETPAETGEPTEDPSEEPADDETETVPDPSGSDLWVEELTGTGELDYSWTAIPGRWVMLVATDGTEPAPRIELTWDRDVVTPFMQPGIILGSVLFVLGLGLLLLQLLTDAEKRRARHAATAAAEAPAVVPVQAATQGDRPLTRREIRLAEEARRRGSRPGQSAASRDGETETIAAVGTPSAATPAESEGVHSDRADRADDPDGTERASELDAWVRCGSASPLMHEGERTTPSDLDVPAEPDAAEAATSEKGTRERWWRRRGGRGSDDSAASPAEELQPQQPAEPDQPTEPATDETSAVEQGDDDPQEWGASWRQTWGLGATDPETDPKEAER